jgi:hypothetical protein
MQRRRLLFTLSAVVSVSLVPDLASAQSSELKETDPEATAVAYKADARKVDRAKSPQYKPGQTCANCSQFFPQDGSPLGGCQLFLGKDVAAAGWCNAWEAKS